MNLELTKRLARRCTVVAAIAAAFTVLGCAETGDGDGNGGATTQPAEQTTSKVTEPTSPKASDLEAPVLEASNLQASDDEATENASTENASTESASSSDDASSPGTTTLVFNVRGMHCGGCAMAVDATVSKLAGVESCTASFENSSAEVVVSDPEASAQIIEAIAKMGYEIEPADESGS